MATATRSDREVNKDAAVAAQMTADREIVIERFYDAPRELVWTAWTQPKHLDQWWGPNGFRNQTLSMDFRVGGVWRYIMHGPDGKPWDNWIRYEEISKNERLAYAHGGDGSDEPQFQVSIAFAVVGKRTKVTMKSVFPTPEALAEVKKFGAIEGGEETMARLTGHLPAMANGSTDQSMVLSRLYDAPAKLLFSAWTTPAGLARWWGPKHFTLPLCEVDFRVGGAYRMTMQDPNGHKYPFHGEYKEIVPNQRIVFSAVIDHTAGIEVMTTVTFAEENGKTLLTVQQTIPADKDAAKGQTEGWSGSLEKLAATLRAA